MFLSKIQGPVFFGLCLFLSALSGCGPKYTYPAANVPESIENITKNENKLDVEARVVGKTVGAVFYIDDILDDKGQIPKDVHEKMGQIMQAVTRVALSTDLPLDFCVVVIRDRAHQNELVITRSLEDTKRANSDAIGVEESINRTLFGQSKYQATPDGQESIFVLKDVKQESFLAEQIAQRIRLNFAKGELKEDPSQQSFVLADGLFDSAADSRRFRFAVLSLKSTEPGETVLTVFRTVNEVLAGYKFNDFKEVEILDYLNRQKLVVDAKTFADYREKKITEQQILDAHLSESQSIQEAFKLFGFNLSDTADAEAPPIAPAAAP